MLNAIRRLSLRLTIRLIEKRIEIADEVLRMHDETDIQNNTSLAYWHLHKAQRVVALERAKKDLAKISA